MRATIIGAGPAATLQVERLALAPNLISSMIAVDIVHTARLQIEEQKSIRYVALREGEVTPRNPDQMDLGTLQQSAITKLRPLLQEDHAIYLFGDLAELAMGAALPALTTLLSNRLHCLTVAGVMPFAHEGPKRARWAQELTARIAAARVTMMVIEPEAMCRAPYNHGGSVERCMQCVENHLMMLAYTVGVLALGPLSEPDLARFTSADEDQTH
jgi:hypothetical protein